MKAKYKKGMLGSVFSILIGTSCCWMSSLIAWIGGLTLLGAIGSIFTKIQVVIAYGKVLLFG